ncbi:MAG: ribonuclease Z [Brumimicrobium sp.]|nr:ribonuclease Z [Brumimicrobium sp.]
MSFDVTILGTGSAIPTLRRGATSQFVNCQQRHILIDCGEGTQLQMRKFKIKFQQIDIVLISHLHGDHVFGLPGLLSTMNLLGRDKGIRIFGPTGIKKLITTQLEQVGLNKVFPLEISEIDAETNGLIYEDKCIEIQTFPLVHRIHTQGYRIQEKPGKRRLIKKEFDKTGVSVAYIDKLLNGQDIIDNEGRVVRSEAVSLPPKPVKSYAFCSDTAYHAPIIDAVTGVDLLYHEATFLEKESERASETYHSTAKQAATIALKAKVKRLVLGHFSARYKDAEAHKKEAQTIFEATFVPEDGEKFII